MLGGIVAGHLAAGRVDLRDPTPRVGWLPKSWPALAVFGLLGTLADIDFLFGIHSRQTHSIGAASMVFVVALWWGRRRPAAFRLALDAALAYGSHIVLDWLGNDTSVPIGIMALWPFSDAFYQSDLHWFPAIWRDTRPGLWTHNAWAAVWELAVLGPFAAASWWWRRPDPGRKYGGSTTEG